VIHAQHDSRRPPATCARSIAKYLGACIATCLAACAAYESRPLDPARTRAEFAARTLDDPKLVEIAHARLPENASFPPGEWDLESLTLVALEYHPDVAIARADLASVRAGTITAAQRPNPTLALDPEYVANAGGGLESWVLGARVDFTIETAGKRDLRVVRAERLSDAAELALFETAWRVRSRLRAMLLEHVMLGRELDLLREEERLRRDTLALLGVRLASGEISRPDLATAEIEHSQVELAIRSVEARQRESLALLASSIGVSENALDGRAFAWPESERAQEFARFEAQRADALLGRVDLRRSLAEYAASEADLELEVAKQYPDVALGPGYLYDQGAHKFLLGLSMPLPIFNQNEGPIAEARARRDSAEVKFLALQAQAVGEIERARARFTGAESELAQANAVLERFRDRERVLARALELGAEDRLAVSEARIQRAIFERASLDARRKVESALGDLEDALQRPLANDGSATKEKLE
jgi:outer membrane protein TolC